MKITVSELCELMEQFSAIKSAFDTSPTWNRTNEETAKQEAALYKERCEELEKIKDGYLKNLKEQHEEISQLRKANERLTETVSAQRELIKVRDKDIEKLSEKISAYRNKVS